MSKSIALSQLTIRAPRRRDLVRGVVVVSSTLRKLGIRKRVIVASIVNAAVRGRLTIDPAVPAGRYAVRAAHEEVP